MKDLGCSGALCGVALATAADGYSSDWAEPSRRRNCRLEAQVAVKCAADHIAGGAKRARARAACDAKRSSDPSFLFFIGPR